MPLCRFGKISAFHGTIVNENLPDFFATRILTQVDDSAEQMDLK